MLKVGLLGLGTMGSGMAAVLLKAGFPLAVYNRSRERAAPFAAQGARVATTPQQAAEGSDVVIAMVADDSASRQIWTARDGALAGAQRGSILIECSTISPAWARELASLAAKHECGFLDAPVTGSRAQASSGALRFLVGGDAPTIQRAEPVLRALGNEIIPFGPVGSGALMKLINNMVCGVQIASLSEAIALIESGGLNRTEALRLLTSGAPGSPLVRGVATRMAEGDSTVNFSVRLMQKDLSYALAEGDSHHVTLDTVRAALSSFRHATDTGLGERDISSVLESRVPPGQ
ncbi:MAG TPA: NAD(P)-dependent oxidoreductase [Terriglobales bacterium]